MDRPGVHRDLGLRETGPCSLASGFSWAGWQNGDENSSSSQVVVTAG
jgi:hypothetical protein